jgi:hypothetical protein
VRRLEIKVLRDLGLSAVAVRPQLSLSQKSSSRLSVANSQFDPRRSHQLVTSDQEDTPPAPADYRLAAADAADIGSNQISMTASWGAHASPSLDRFCDERVGHLASSPHHPVVCSSRIVCLSFSAVSGERWCMLWADLTCSAVIFITSSSVAPVARKPHPSSDRCSVGLSCRPPWVRAVNLPNVLRWP